MAARKRQSAMARLEAVALALPEAERVDIEAWDGHPTFRVRSKNFVFSDKEASHLSFKLTREEAEAVLATVAEAEPTGYGLGRHGWVSLNVAPDASDERWDEIVEWVTTSYCLVAPKKLAREVEARYPPA